MKNKKYLRILQFFAVLISIIFAFSGCYSVFSGGTGGLVVDKESTSTPKQGIANVDVYAYLSGSERDSDFASWKEGTVFYPKAEYYGHTTTNNDGHFSISKLTWKENSPDFGKDADYTNVYLIFYHENYGITKGQTVIISDSNSDTVYQELESIRKTTVLTLNFVDVSTGTNTSQNIFVKVEVPQTTQNLPSALPKTYQTTLAGTGNITISYPRWKNNDDRQNSIENTPEVNISYIQSADEITWAGCYNADNEEKNYAFRPDASTGIKKTIMNSNYTMTFYGKPQKIMMPNISGQYLSDDAKAPYGTKDDDGVLLKLYQIDADGNFSTDCGQVYTQPQTLGTSGNEKHGTFSGLGNGSFWYDTEYTEKFAATKVKIQAPNISEETPGKSKIIEIRGDNTSVTVQL